MAKQKRSKDFALAKGHAFKDKFPKQYDKTDFVYVENKFDGLRGVIAVGKGKACAYTSSGVKVVNAKHLCEALNITPYHNRVYDGEFFYKDWNTTVSIVKTQTLHPLRKKLQFKIFDCMTLAEWRARKCEKPLYARKGVANTIIAFVKRPEIIKEVVSKKIPKTIEAANKALKRACKHGHEGCMLKDPNAGYEWKRTANWLKMKPYWEDDMVIIGAENGTDGKQHAKVLGNLIVKGVIDGKQVKTNVGCGFTHSQRKELWDMHKKKKLIGKRIMMKHEGVTKNNAVRFPEFLRLRIDD